MWTEIVDTDVKSAGWKIADTIVSELGGGWNVIKEDAEVGSSAVTVASISNSGFDTSMTIMVNSGKGIYLYYNCGGQKIEAASTVLGNNNIIGLEIYKSPKGTAFAISMVSFMNNNGSLLKYVVAKNAKGEDAVLTAKIPSTSTSDAKKTYIYVVKKGLTSSYSYPSMETSDIVRYSNTVVLNKMVDWSAQCMYDELYEIRMCPRTYDRKPFEIKGKKYISITNDSGCYGGITFQASNFS